MITYEYHAKLLKDWHLSVPADIKSKLRPDSEFRVLILQEEGTSEWNKLTASEFLKGYSAKDRIYDNI